MDYEPVVINRRLPFLKQVIIVLRHLTAPLKFVMELIITLMDNFYWRLTVTVIAIQILTAHFYFQAMALNLTIYR